MLRTIIISSDTELSEQLANALQDTGLCALVRTVDTRSAGTDLIRCIRELRPQLVVLNSDEARECVVLAREIRDTMPWTQMIAAGRNFDPDTLMELADFGAFEFIGAPFQAELV